MDAVEDIKARLSIEDVFSEYVELKRAGRNFKALSPFTNEKTPSLMVSPEKQIWHDFSSGKGGNMFSFVMEMEGVDFKGALELLARKAGIDLSLYRSGSSQERGKAKERLYKALEAAARFYQVQFSKHQAALEYIFKQRRFDKQTALDFRIGYSPNGGSALTDYLKKQGFSDDELKKAGLSTQRYGRLQDMFRGRIMIPLADPFGRIIGFTARLLEDEPNAPKYINTPQTLLYDKGRHVFGLHLAKEAIRQSKFVVAVEGNLDVVASQQAGVKNVVATAGTAMTEMHLKALARLAPDVRLAFDADRAGLNATERTIPIASRVGINLSIVAVPEGQDPDGLIRKNPHAWEEVISRPVYAVDWMIDRYRASLDLESAQGKREFSDVVLKVVSQLRDSVEQDHYVQKVAGIVGVSPEAMRSKLAGQGRAEPARRLKPGKAVAKVSPRSAEALKSQQQLLALTLMRPELRSYLEPLTPEMLQEPDARQLLEFLKANPEATDLKKAPALRPIGDYVKVVALQFEELYGSVEDIELQYEAARLQARVLKQYIQQQKAAITEALRTSETAATRSLLEKAKELDALLKSLKEK